MPDKIVARFMHLSAIGVMLLGLLLYPTERLMAGGKAPVSYDDFKALQGENFSVYGGQRLRKVVSMKLIEVSQPKENTATVMFAVRFQGPVDYPLDKAVYTLEQEKTGAFPLFLEPAGADSQGLYYQALFNLLK